MASSSRAIPHLLEPYLRDENTTASSPSTPAGDVLGPDLVIATSVLGASTNWLILRYLYSFLKQPSPPRNLNPEDGDQPETAAETTTTTTSSVVLVSFLRDYAFWKENAGRIGLDLDVLSRAGRFNYIDGLSVELFHSTETKGGGGGGGATGNNIARGSAIAGVGSGSAGRMPGLSPIRPKPIVPGRQPPGPVRGPVPILGAGAGGVGGRIPASMSSASTAATTTTPAAGGSVLTSSSISHLRKVISDAVESVGYRTTTTSSGPQKNNTVLIIDQLDFLLAATAGSSGVLANGGPTANGDEISAQALKDLLLDLRETTDKTILTLSADQPLIDSQTTTLEKEHANFVLSLLHEASMVLSLRLLDTGVAKDVSGVVRITAGGGGRDRGGVEENEYLYHVRGDGSVRVFERGQ